jgi:hypothetical protein
VVEEVEAEEDEQTTLQQFQTAAATTTTGIATKRVATNVEIPGTLPTDVQLDRAPNTKYIIDERERTKFYHYYVQNPKQM